MHKKHLKCLAGILTVAILSSGSPVWAAEAQFSLESEQETFADDQAVEFEAEFSSDGQEIFSSGTDGEVEDFADAEEQVLLSGLPVLADTVPDGSVDPVTQAQIIGLGDSISTGYGLADKNGSFLNLISKNTGMTVSNAAIDGATSEVVLGLLASGKLDAQLAGADVVTMTIGGNDMMAVFYQMIADTYNAASGDSLAALDVPLILADPTNEKNAAVTQAALGILMGGYDQVKPAFTAALSSIGENVKSIASYIKAKNPNATILIANQYNPYKWLEGAYSMVALFFNQAVLDLNSVLASAESGAGTLYTVVDVYTAFAASEENLCNATSLPLNLDFHPNAKGHEVLSTLFGNEIDQGEPEDPQTAPVVQDVYATGNTVYAQLSQEVEGFEGYDFVIGAQDCIETKEYVQVCKNQTDTGAEFYYIPEGTYYVYCHAWVKDENNIKQFGDWSEGYQVQVIAVTPETPEITDIVVNTKGDAVKVTYTKCENATGYDLVLGKEYKKVNVEYRPVNYGANVIKVKNADTLTVIFRNVEKGTYYVGLHSYNRTSEDQKKVFSYWSDAKKITVR